MSGILDLLIHKFDFQLEDSGKLFSDLYNGGTGLVPLPTGSKQIRKERFLGHTIGGDGITGGGSRNIKFVTDGIERNFRCNDKPRRSVPIGFGLLDESSTGRALKDAVYDWLMSVIPEAGDGLLQCNVNFYGLKSGLNWHRDDLDPSSSTFYPGSVTVVVQNPDIEKSNLLISSAFQLAVVEDESALQHRPCEKHQRNCFSNLTRSCFDLTPESNAVLDVPLGIYGRGYRFGLHRAEMIWREKSPKDKDLETSFARMSLNFRLVRPEVWNLLPNK